MLISGNMGSGKTTWLINKYTELISKGAKTSEILVICQNSHLKEKFVEALKKAGIYGQSYPVYTFNGLAYRSILNNWPVFENILPEKYGKSVVSPDMTGVNVTSYVIKKNVEKVGFDDYLSGQNLMYQLLRRYALISHNALSQEEIDAKSELLNETFAKDAKKVFKDTVEDMLKYRTFDYLRQTQAFMALFRQNKIKDFDRVKYLLVDDFDEMTYQGFSFVKTLSAKVDEYYIAFDRHGGARRGYLCAYADGWRDFDDEILELSLQPSDAQIIFDNFTTAQKQALSSFEFVNSEQNIDMAQKILDKISFLLESDVNPCDIRIIAPESGDALRYSLESYFIQNEIPYQFLSGTKRLYDDKFVFAAVVI
ncbi:MAG: AAA family ATPase, partial [Candidatus Gastranaerophilales bacterium]|nr:AAA family ATPase [Candidatus Gastranaerophilales bacterium]